MAGRPAEETRLDDIVVSQDPNYELGVAEGFKNSAVAKVLFLLRKMPSLSPENAIAVAGDREGINDVPCYSRHEPDGLASQLWGR